jgi:hypothetical protein
MMQTGSNWGRLELSRALAVLATLFVTTVSGCAPRSTPPGADVTAGVFEQVGFEFLRWEEGLAIMMWHDFVGDSGCSSTSEGSGFTPDPIYRVEGYAESWDGHRFDWEVQTNDGKTAQFWIDGRRYDLSDGTLFIVTMEDGGADVMQLERDVSRVQPDSSSCVAFARSDPDLARFIGDTSTSSAASPTSVSNPMPTAAPAPNGITPPGSWVTYTNSAHGFSLRHPAGFDVPPTDFNEWRGFIGDQVVFSVGEQDPYWLGCFFEGVGDCPVMEDVELTRVGDPTRNGIRISGYIGSIGGRIPQQYVTYVMREGGTYYAFTLYALGGDREVERVDVIWPLDEADVVVFERMMETLRFRVGSRG